MPIAKLLANYNHITEILEQSIDSHNMELMGEYLEELTRWYGITPQMTGDARYYMDISHKYQYDQVVKMIKAGDLPTEFNGVTSSSVLKEYIRSRNAEFNALYEAMCRLNSSMGRRSDTIRTLLSKEKEVYKNTMMGSTQGNKYKK